MNLTLAILGGVLTGRLPAYTLTNYVLICSHIHPAYPYVYACLHAMLGEIPFSLFYEFYRSDGVETVREMRQYAAESADESLMEAAREVEEELAHAVELYQDCRTLRQRLRVATRFANAETKIRQSFTRPERILDFFDV